ncbi:MAG TPA: superoxide dismutase [Tenericutes bacterium]|nr:superoxide dismutase [Mycoplasmatota bacterium]
MYELKPLRYSENSLEPYISSKTVDIHYNKHAKNYLNKLNNILNELNYDFSMPLNELVVNIEIFPIEKRDDVLFNAGGVLNHDLYFSNISPNRNIYPTGQFLEAIDKQFGSFENFKNEFIKKANILTGSGYTFLVLTRDNKLEIINTTNQETPYLYGLKPIMTIDLWEHAYYLDYQNRRSDYINNFFEIIDFEVVGKLYEENIK